MILDPHVLCGFVMLLTPRLVSGARQHELIYYPVVDGFLGTVTQFEGQQVEFASGAISASFVFFFSLGYGARYLRGLFEKPRAWQVLEFLIGTIMWGIAAKLLFMQ
ncbi:MAG: LysE family transporter [Aestuariibacter sp.]|nr:LysE family transporter [Aestuariibacter sp.]